MLHVRMLGVFSADCAGRPIRFSTRKVAGLLALLVIRPGAAVSRTRLTAMLWPESGESAARTSLRQGLAALRRDLGDTEGLLIRTDADTIRLPPELATSDAAQLETCLAAPNGVFEAARLYTGDLLDGFDAGAEPFEAWRRAEAARLRDRVTGALTAGLARATDEAVITLGNALLALDPTAEEAHQALIRLHLARGALGAAMRQYERCRDALSRELGVVPSPETEALHLRIRAPRPVETDSQPTLAVLPFIDLSDDPDQAWLARAFAEDLTAELGRFRVLRVIAAASVAAIHDHAAAPHDTAERLGARYLLTGSLRRSKDQVRLAADLTDAREGRHLWSQRLDLPAERLQAAEDDMAATIAATLVKRLEHKLVQEARGKPTADLRAWECWLRGLSLLRTGATEHQDEAEALFTQALALDPGFACAEAGLSLVQFNEWSCMAWDRWDERERRAYAHAMRAVALDPAEPLAHFILSRVLTYRRDFAKAEYHLARAEALNPNDADVQTQLALACCQLGQPERGRQAASLAARLNPFHDDWYYAYAAMPEFFLGEYEAALALMDRAPEIAADMDAYRAAAEAHRSRMVEARAALERFHRSFRQHITFGRTPEPGEAARWLVHINPCARPQDLARLLDGVRQAGLEIPPDLLTAGTVRSGRLAK
jgi:TolB-like protein